MFLSQPVARGALPSGGSKVIDPISMLSSLPSFTGGSARSDATSVVDTRISFNNPFSVGGAADPVGSAVSSIVPVAALMIAAYVAVRIWGK